MDIEFEINKELELVTKVKNWKELTMMKIGV